jgi:hypothetical protein
MGRLHGLVHLFVIVALFSGSVAALFAQNERFLGIWELNLAKSSITRGAPPRSEMIVNVADFRSALSVVTERGTGVEIHHTTSTAGSTRRKDPIRASSHSGASTRIRSSRTPAAADKLPSTVASNFRPTAKR